MKNYSFEDIWQYMNDDRRMREFIQKEGVNKEGFKKSLEMFFLINCNRAEIHHRKPK